MNLLILSKSYGFKLQESKFLKKSDILELKKLSSSLYIIAKKNPFFDYKTIMDHENGINIIYIQQYPFVNPLIEDFYTENIRAQEGLMLILKNQINIDYIILDNIDYSLAAKSCSDIYKIPIIYLKYSNCFGDSKLNDIREWITVKSNYVVTSKKCYVKQKEIFPNNHLKNTLDLLQQFMKKAECD